MNDADDMYIITLSYACFAVFVNDGVITDAAPIGRWMVGRRVDDVCKWVRSKHGSVDYNNINGG